MNKALLKSFFYSADSIIFVLLLVAGIVFTAGFEDSFDISLYDESAYLYSGVNFFKASAPRQVEWETVGGGVVGLPPLEWAPLYSLWYYVISIFQPDRIGLFFFNFRLLTIIPPVIFYILFRSYGVSAVTSAAASSIFIFTPANYSIAPKVSHFALCVILSATALAGRTSSILSAVLVSLFGAMMVTLIRPEYCLSFFISLVLFIMLLFFERQALSKRKAIVLITCALAFTIIFIAMVNILIHGERSMCAFGQHFSYNWLKSKHFIMDHWTEWKEVMATVFSGADSVAEAFYNNPAAFLCHMADNENELIGKIPVFSIVVIACSFIYYYPRVRSNFFEYRNFLVLCCIFIIPGIVSTIVIFPREHYLLLSGGLVAAVSIVLLFSDISGRSKPLIEKLVPLLLIAIAMIPFLRFVNEKLPRPNLETIKAIRTLKITVPVNLLEAEGGYDIYLGDNYRRVAQYSKNQNFNRFMVERKINMIVISNVFQKDVRYREDREWRRFVKNCTSLGFVKVCVPNSNRTLIVKSELLYR